jgi:hypothetical protein
MKIESNKLVIINLKTMKKIIVLMFVAAICMSAGAKRPLIINRPCVAYNRFDDIKLLRVEFTDTATILSIRFIKKAGADQFRFNRYTHLLAQDGSWRKLKCAKGIELDTYNKVKADSCDFKLVFDPLPRHTQYFDMVEQQDGGCNLYGIHDIKAKLDVYPRDKRYRINGWSEFLKGGKAYLKIKFEGSHPDEITIEHINNFTGAAEYFSLPVNADGTLFQEVYTDYPYLTSFANGNRHHTVSIIPGDTCEMKITAWNDVSYSSSSRMGHLLNMYAWTQNVSNPISDEGIRYIANRFLLTPEEYNMAIVDKNYHHALNELDNIFQQTVTNFGKKDSSFDVKRLFDLNNFDPDNYLAVSSEWFYPFIHQYNTTLFFLGLQRERDRINRSNFKKEEDERFIREDTAFWKCDKPSIFAQLAFFNADDILKSDKDSLELARTIEKRRKYITDPVLRAYYDKEMKKLVSQRKYIRLDASKPGQKFLLDMIAPYKGKHIVINFWCMHCGACIWDIENTKKLRSDIHKNTDIKLLFLCEGSCSDEAYHEFADKNLTGEDTYLIAPEIYRRFWSEFHFIGYPSYIEVLPDGRVNLNTNIRLTPICNLNDFMGKLSKE